MSESLRIPMWAGKSLIGLNDILSVVPVNEWEWRLWDFFGTGQAPEGSPMAEFEQRVTETPEGVGFNWPEIANFAAGLDQTHDCLLTAAQPHMGPTPAQVSDSNWDACLLVISAEDSTEWRLWARLDAELNTTLVSAWRALARCSET
ncbi:hypothetical protein SAMN06297387_1322 [Streptomyces zhaozhouensis]|uniref:Uncharacterized protein n=1 Tax=Streptomyces zhaozhouensis TaxID=1300267 RepID=A0A286E9G6_9ACTN|nr:hypothetical protein [Streptomyces zhaozhouensis]SOD67547.1 hypothetical protein SAMN06297387_1322 [Streptomyces zhaozhouensis]